MVVIIIAILVNTVVFALFPVRIQTSSQAAQTLLYSVSVPASAMLLLLCFLAMLCFSEKKTGNYTTGVL